MTVTLRITDDDGATDEDTAIVAITNIAPTIIVEGGDTVTEGSEYSLTLGTITDPGIDTVTHWTVHWGDGETKTYDSGGEKTHIYDHDGAYTIIVDLVDEDGTFTGVASKEIAVNPVGPEITDLGQIDFLALENLGLAGGRLFYRVETSRDGIFTMQVDAPQPVASAGLKLYDANPVAMAGLAPLAESSLDEHGNQRIDWPTVAGTVYYIEVFGDNVDFALRVANLLHHDAQTGAVTIHGTSGDDTFEFGPTASIEVTINGVGYVFHEAQVETVNFDGTDGYDTATLTSADTNDNAEVWHDHGTFIDGGITATLTDVESINIDSGGGEDTVIIHDSPGDDELYARAVTSYQPVTSITVTDFDYEDPEYISTYAHSLTNFEILSAYSTAGIDIASFYDSDGDDELIAKQFETVLSGEGFSFRAENFQFTHGYAKAGGNDRAELYDTPRNDRFKADPTYARMFKGAFQRRAKFFETVVAYANSGGASDRDDARLFDSTSADQFIATPTESRLYSETAGYDITVVSFDEVLARASSGYDVATFIGGAGNDYLLHKWLRHDIMVKSPKTEMMDFETKGEVYKVTARRFNRTTAQDGKDGYDIAKFWDTLEADRFVADGDTAAMYCPDTELLYDAIAFEKVVFNHVNGGNDRTEKAASYDFLLSEFWAE